MDIWLRTSLPALRADFPTLGIRVEGVMHNCYTGMSCRHCPANQLIAVRLFRGTFCISCESLQGHAGLASIVVWATIGGANEQEANTC